ncbi:MAG: hypothetical protein ACN4GF_06155 [Lentimonas sp.]
MSQNTNDSQKEVKVEDLLRLKRAERPDDAFWGEFDKELHQRMLQTLVKKDPLHLQIWRTLSGRLTQSVGVACAAAFLALMVVRPAFIGTTTADISVARVEGSAAAQLAVVEVAMSDLDVSVIEGARDYSIEGISADVESSDARFTREFGMEGFEMAMDADYSSDVASMRPSFGSTGVATTLIY